ncbi:MAG: ATP-dependent Clp protease proteolytic subunit, partial [Paracoccaceae bacterium]
DMRAMAEALEKIGASLIKGYAAKSGKAEQDIAALMAAETWFDAKDALEAGLATRLAEPVRIAAAFDIARFCNAPPELVAAAAKTVEPCNGFETPREGVPDGNTRPDEADPGQTAAIRSDAMTYAKTVVDLCRLAGQPQMAAGFLEAETGLEDVRKALIDARAASEPDISVHHSQPGKTSDSRPWADVIARTFKRKG